MTSTISRDIVYKLKPKVIYYLRIKVMDFINDFDLSLYTVLVYLLLGYDFR